MKSKNIKNLEKLAFDAKVKKYPTMPLFTIPAAKYSDSTTNGLTKCIIDYINLQDDATAWRVNNVGIFDTKTQRHRKAATIKGIADITAIRNGTTYQIEIKTGKDKMSDDQKKFAERVIKSGANYFVIKSFDDFIEQWNSQNVSSKNILNNHLITT
jgi:hypothetical protein